uniref:Transmembrane protein 161A n=1 Tax=Serinus canaria TaxID=9135 RepID=A0A8C9MYV6_SERCA
MGVQVVVTLLAASLMQKMAPHCSFARWLLCNGSLYRYKHPSDEELCALAGKQRPKSKRDRSVSPGANGVAEDKPLSVPRDIELQLDTSPITAVDAHGDRCVPSAVICPQPSAMSPAQCPPCPQPGAMSPAWCPH